VVGQLDLARCAQDHNQGHLCPAPIRGGTKVYRYIAGFYHERPQTVFVCEECGRELVEFIIERLKKLLEEEEECSGDDPGLYCHQEPGGGDPSREPGPVWHSLCRGPAECTGDPNRGTHPITA
jgi:hypothetical protein